MLYEVITTAGNDTPPLLVDRLRRHIGLSVDENLLIANLHGIAGEPNDPLDEVTALPEGLAAILRELENDDIGAFRLANGQKTPVHSWYLHAVNKLVHQQVITDQQRVLHRSRGNFKIV